MGLLTLTRLLLRAASTRRSHSDDEPHGSENAVA